MVLVVVASLRCVRALRRRAHCGLLLPLGKLVSTLMALRELALLEMNCTYVRLLRMHFCPVQLAQVRLVAVLLQQSLCKASRRPPAKRVPRLFEPSLRVATDLATLSTLTARAASSSSASLAKLSQSTDRRESFTHHGCAR